MCRGNFLKNFKKYKTFSFFIPLYRQRAGRLEEKEISGGKEYDYFWRNGFTVTAGSDNLDCCGTGTLRRRPVRDDEGNPTGKGLLIAVYRVDSP
jgi:hypothetical protein